ncbi:NapC/NirT family cytochrome c [Kaarinaea lacus]
MPKCPSTRAMCVGLVIFLIGGISFGGLTTFFHYTNRTEFCTSCHSMETNYTEYKQTTHFKNTSGVQASCADCHVPQEFGPMFVSKLLAVKDVVREITGTIDTPEKFAARRWLLANVVWEKMRATDSRECRSCHDYESMDTDTQDKRTRNKHLRAPKKGQTCIDCHSGIAHDEPLEPDADEQVALNDNNS